MIKQAVILVGGEGTRLGNFAKNVPKPLLEVGGQPFLNHVIWNLTRQGIGDVVLLAGYQSQLIEDCYRAGKIFGANVTVLSEPEPLGTAGGLVEFQRHLEDSFWVLNGDTFFDLHLPSLHTRLVASGMEAGLVCLESSDRDRFGSLEIGEDGNVAGFGEKQEGLGTGYISGGVYLLRRQHLPTRVNGHYSMEQDLLPKLVNDGKLLALPEQGYFIDIGIPASLDQARRDFPSILEKPALFFDRDGVLNKDEGYTHAVSSLELIDGAAEAVAAANKKGYYVIVVSNQGGVAKGLYGDAEVHAFHEALAKQVSLKGGHIDRFYYCRHHPDGIEPNSRQCECRKPKPGMILEALNDWPVKLTETVLVGDKQTDVEAADAAGIPGLRFDGTNLFDFLKDKGIL